MKIASQGFPYIGLSLLLAGACSAFSSTRPLALVFLLLAAFVTFFFRDPKRVAPNDSKVLVSPGDGRVVYVGAAEDGSARKQLTMFLSLFDVHINRSPLTATVNRVQYTPGRFLAAYKKEASTANERNEMELVSDGFEVIVRQIAGVVARRIVCNVKENDRLEQGQRFGLIQFGSRMEVVLPAECELTARVGDHLRGGESIIGRRP
jgi:phosphatidylserine decarboxylase